MQFTTALAILIAATGISAAPTEEKRITSVQLEIFAGASCGSPTPITTATIITDGVCRPIGVPPFSGNTDAGFLLNSLPAGCTLQVYSDSACGSVNVLPYNTFGDCRTFGAGKFLGSAKTVGTCS